MDDWSALELEGDDEDIENLFGHKSSLQPSKISTALPARPSPQLSQCSVLQPSHNTAFCAHPSSAPAATSAIPRPPVLTHANSRKRVAASLGPSPNRVAGQSLLNGLTDTAYDELELESCSALTDANTSNRSRGTYESQSTVVRHNLPQHSAKTNVPSQTTEQWLGLPEPSQHRPQPIMQRPASMPAASNHTRTNAMHLDALQANEDTLPGPAGVLQRAQASGMQMPQLASLTGQSIQSASQWQRQQHSLHPEFLSPAWQSAMEALGLSCFDDSSLMLQHHVKNIMLCPASCKLPKAILLIESMAYTGSGSAFAQLKDPTGSIGAGIHTDVFQAEEGVSLGAVLMLQQVPLLVLSKNTRYLCITAGNIMQIRLLPRWKTA